jgi:hypothetical protein
MLREEERLREQAGVYDSDMEVLILFSLAVIFIFVVGQ